MLISVTITSQRLTGILSAQQRRDMAALRSPKGTWNLMIYNNGSVSIFADTNTRIVPEADDEGIPIAAGKALAIGISRLEDLILQSVTSTNTEIRLISV